MAEPEEREALLKQLDQQRQKIAGLENEIVQLKNQIVQPNQPGTVPSAAPQPVPHSTKPSWLSTYPDHLDAFTRPQRLFSTFFLVLVALLLVLPALGPGSHSFKGGETVAGPLILLALFFFVGLVAHDVATTGNRNIGSFQAVLKRTDWFTWVEVALSTAAIGWLGSVELREASLLAVAFVVTLLPIFRRLLK